MKALRYLAALTALGLGGGIVIAHLRQPPIPLLPGRGCITTSFPGPSTSTAEPRLEFESCVHISETLFSLQYFESAESAGSMLFDASGPEGPQKWAEHFAIRWQSRDTVLVTYDSTILMRHRDSTIAGVQVVYRRVPEGTL
ncbi:MAG TPA: hypothetical protein VG692_13535 [Gemmatimonadales bacterium]|nr:hypothetical protein [Gemmatimonadales bacterium]